MIFQHIPSFVKALFSRESNFSCCWKCEHFSRSTKGMRCRKSFKLLRPKFWRFIFYKMNFWTQGVCTLTVIDQDGDHLKDVPMRGFEKCAMVELKGYEIDAKKLIGNLDIPDTDDVMEVENAILAAEKREMNRHDDQQETSADSERRHNDSERDIAQEGTGTVRKR